MLEVEKNIGYIQICRASSKIIRKHLDKFALKKFKMVYCTCLHFLHQGLCKSMLGYVYPEYKILILKSNTSLTAFYYKYLTILY